MRPVEWRNRNLSPRASLQVRGEAFKYITNIENGSRLHAMDLRLVQLKGGKAGVTGEEIKRLRKAAENLRPTFLIAEFDGETLQFLPSEPG